jgi:glycosyltransferase involved in cell wall biosynthesis
MSIVVHGCFLQQRPAALTDDFLFETIQRMAPAHPEQSFLFIVPAATGLRHPLYQQGNTVLQPAVTGGLLTRTWWSAVQLPALLKKQQAQVWVSGEVTGINTKLPKVQLVTQLLPVRRPRASRLAKLLAKTHTVVAVSEWCRQQLVTAYGVAEGKIIVIPAAASPLFQPVEWTEKEVIKKQYAEGHEYFIFQGKPEDPAAVTHMLKAFSVFKKWQKSKMKLLLTGISADNVALQKLDLYRFRADVALWPKPAPEELAALTASAYALVCTATQDAAGTAVLRAMCCEVPVIATETGALPEICGDAALYSPATDFKATGNNMIQVYKDEAFRNRLIAKGRQRKAAYSWEITAAAFWQVLAAVTSEPAK